MYFGLLQKSESQHVTSQHSSSPVLMASMQYSVTFLQAAGEVQFMETFPGYDKSTHNDNHRGRKQFVPHCCLITCPHYTRLLIPNSYKHFRTDAASNIFSQREREIRPVSTSCYICTVVPSWLDFRSNWFQTSNSSPKQNSCGGGGGGAGGGGGVVESF